MAGSPTFSTEAADTLVTAYLNQPEGNRDLRRVLTLAQQNQLDAEKHIVREIASMSKSQAYELLRHDDRTRQNPDLFYEGIDEAKAKALELAYDTITRQHAMKEEKGWYSTNEVERASKIIMRLEARTPSPKAEPDQQHTDGLSNLLA